jgi:hypothetical protein
MEGRYIPPGALKIASKRSPAVAYLYSRASGIYAMGYFGKAIKPAFNYRFKADARRIAYVSEWLKSQDAFVERKVARKAEEQAKRAAGHKLKVGDVLRSSWGYDQTNIDYYEVVELVGKCNVKVREIGAESVETGFMSGQCVPVAGSYIEGKAAKLCRVTPAGDSVKVRDWGVWAYKMEPIVAGGVKAGYRSSSWSSYA